MRQLLSMDSVAFLLLHHIFFAPPQPLPSPCPSPCSFMHVLLRGETLDKKCGFHVTSCLDRSLSDPGNKEVDTLDETCKAGESPEHVVESDLLLYQRSLTGDNPLIALHYSCARYVAHEQVPSPIICSMYSGRRLNGFNLGEIICLLQICAPMSSVDHLRTKFFKNPSHTISLIRGPIFPPCFALEIQIEFAQLWGVETGQKPT